MNVDVGVDEVEYWRVGSKAAAVLDTLVDEEGRWDILAMFETVVSDQPRGIEGVLTDEEAQELAIFYKGLSPEDKKPGEPQR